VLLSRGGVEITYSRTGQGAAPSWPKDNQSWDTRDDTGEHYTYIRNPDGNLIELMYHPPSFALRYFP
jgi:hypothetical protein